MFLLDRSWSIPKKNSIKIQKLKKKKKKKKKEVILSSFLDNAGQDRPKKGEKNFVLSTVSLDPSWSVPKIIVKKF